jgi:hypothetical protein
MFMTSELARRGPHSDITETSTTEPDNHHVKGRLTMLTVTALAGTRRDASTNITRTDTASREPDIRMATSRPVVMTPTAAGRPTTAYSPAADPVFPEIQHELEDTA